mmetsp:Transcript_117435/g.184688  ORF Transcript_117435/g.184688 Transcript_117435/m.184688 type:complete len:181 (-) Transcript_117435:141-683(-)
MERRRWEDLRRFAFDTWDVGLVLLLLQVLAALLKHGSDALLKPEEDALLKSGNGALLKVWEDALLKHREGDLLKPLEEAFGRRPLENALLEQGTETPDGTWLGDLGCGLTIPFCNSSRTAALRIRTCALSRETSTTKEFSMHLAAAATHVTRERMRGNMMISPRLTQPLLSMRDCKYMSL